METERPPAPGPACGHPSPRAAGPEPVAAPVLVPAPPQEPEPRAPGTWAGMASGPLTPSAHIPESAHRVPQGKAWLDEVMAATALTSLSTSPPLLGCPAAGFHAEPGLEPWSEPPLQLPGSHSSSGSSGGDWGWDPASEQSSSPTPSPPLPLEAAHFLFGEPAPQKRKGTVQVLFQCLWKRCGEVLSSASRMQRHIRLAHLGRQAEPEQSDGEEDFYYTELDIGLEVLTGGLSTLTSMPPTASLTPAFPHLELLQPPALPSLLRPLALPPPQVLSGDHSYQGCLAPTRLHMQPSPAGAREPALPSTHGASLRKPWGDTKKCRKAYGVQRRDLWCTACRWKKACQRFLGTTRCLGRPSSQRRK